jgi:DNA-binding helix-hairpin-helix protein with protein kinase domain
VHVVFDSSGNKLTLGHCLGSGGEGAVYDVPARAGEVVKLYRLSPSEDKAAKLRVMARLATPSLLGIAAWPKDVAYGRPGKSPVGFFMPKVVTHQEIHKLYGPAHRKVAFPKADWSFLVHVARNLAAAMDTMHAAGLVIGDVNQGNIVVADTGTVKLIDCDSFQVAANGRIFLCEVGVSHFTPPELQGQSFSRVQRSANHDYFGLAVLCFHLLFMGRHPFVGTHSASADPSIERSIREYLFAFGTTAASRGVRPPPFSLTLAHVPDDVGHLFEQAFGPAGAAAGGRPTARHWLQALDRLKGSLLRCAANRTHTYPRHVAKCPWCDMERTGGPIFFAAIVATGIASADGRFDLRIVWGRISAVRSPGPVPLPAPELAAVTGAPLPSSVLSQKRRRATRVLLGVVTAFAIGIAGIGVELPALVLLAIIAGVLVTAHFGRLTPEERAERDRRRTNREHSAQRLRALQQQWEQRATDRAFVAKLQTLQTLRTQYEGLDAEYRRAHQQLLDGRRDAQLKRYLEQHFLDHHKIDGIGPGRLATLASYGVETAADVSPTSLSGVPGFGPKLTARVLAWRTQLERRFVFDASKGIYPNDLAALDARFGQKRQEVEKALSRGVEELEGLRRGALQQREILRPQIERTCRELNKAEADLALA